MSKSKLPKWRNPTGDDIWDEYYNTFYFWLGFFILLLGGIVLGSQL